MGYTLLEWVEKSEVDKGMRAGVPTKLADKLKALERENRALRQSNKILCKSAAFCQSPHPPIMSVLHSGGMRRACRRGRGRI